MPPPSPYLPISLQTHDLNEEERFNMLEQKSPGEYQQPLVEQGTLFDKAELERLRLQRQHWEETTVQQVAGAYA